MMTLKRFKALADSYGGDLNRWPEDLRPDAARLLEMSQEARRLLDQARGLDTAIHLAARYEDARLWPGGDQSASLTRLRASIAHQIAASAGEQAEQRAAPLGWLRFLGLKSLGLAAGGIAAVMAGLVIGAVYPAAPASNNLVAMLQPAPISFLGN